MKTKKIFKLVAIALCSMVAVSSFAGCKGNSSSVDVDSLDLPGAEVTLNGDKIYPVSCEDTIELWCGTSINWTTSYQNFDYNETECL